MVRVFKVFRAFLNLGFAKPMFSNPGLFTKTTGITEMTKTTQTPTTRGSVAGEAQITDTTEMTKTPGIWGAKPRFPKTWVLKSLSLAKLGAELFTTTAVPKFWPSPRHGRYDFPVLSRIWVSTVCLGTQRSISLSGANCGWLCAPCSTQLLGGGGVPSIASFVWLQGA